MPEAPGNWNALQQTLEGHSDWVRAVAFSSDGKLVASSSGDRTVKLWDTTTGKERLRFTGVSALGSVGDSLTPAERAMYRLTGNRRPDAFQAFASLYLALLGLVGGNDGGSKPAEPASSAEMMCRG